MFFVPVIINSRSYKQDRRNRIFYHHIKPINNAHILKLRKEYVTVIEVTGIAILFFISHEIFKF